MWRSRPTLPLPAIVSKNRARSGFFRTSPYRGRFPPGRNVGANQRSRAGSIDQPRAITGERGKPSRAYSMAAAKIAVVSSLPKRFLGRGPAAAIGGRCDFRSQQRGSAGPASRFQKGSAFHGESSTMEF